MKSKWCCSPVRPRRATNVSSSRGTGRVRNKWLLLLALCVTPAARSNDAPAWMHALVSAPLPAHDDKDDAVVLYSEEILTVQPSGKMHETDRIAFKILRPGGRSLGRHEFPFDPEQRITNLHGWCIPAQGKDYEVKDKDLTEHGYFERELMLLTDVRTREMVIPAADPGNIIGYEVEYDRRPYILQDDWYFQDRFPVADTRYTLQLPAGWEYKAVWVNHPEAASTSPGNNQFQWELKDIPEVRHEEDMPPWKGVAGLMIISLLPPGSGMHGFTSWSEMGAWYTGLIQGRRDASPEIKQKVAEVTANMKTPLAKMRVLAELVQRDIRYVGIELGIGGWQPHAAKDIFAHRYGDCKDKATLLSTMLKEVGIDSYYVVIHTRRGGVGPSTPAHLGSFNHAILAIHIPDGVGDASLVSTYSHPKLGRLLFFDPTDEMTPFGVLPGPLQANYGLLVTPDGGELIQLPQLRPGYSGVTRTAKLVLDPQGNLRGQFHEERVGDAASHQRYELRGVTRDADRIKPVETLMAQSLSNFQIGKAVIFNLTDTSQPFEYEWNFATGDYAKNAGGLLLVRPRVLGVKSQAILETKEPRKYSIEFQGPSRDIDNFEIVIPAGYEVDDLPPPADADYSFGSYHSKVEAKNGRLLYTRAFEIKELSVPVSKADDLKKFYRIIATDERNTAVLKPSTKSASSQ
jgi:Domain of Unknown Function with PDB structure (DUF3857)/Transglutaminase-like superfamily